MMIIGFLKVLIRIIEHGYVYKARVSILTKTGEEAFLTQFISSQNDPMTLGIMNLSFFSYYCPVSNLIFII